MEYVDGPSAADMLREHKRLDIDETVRLVRDACHGLDYAHRAGVVHRDVKPGNLLFAEEMGATKLADFGIAKAAEQTRITQVGSVLGTAAYLSPEQARGEEAGPASDIYSLGVCAYQFLTGRLPHEYTSLTELALKQQQDPVDPISDYRPEVPPELDEAVRLALERDPDARYSHRARDGRGDRGRRCAARPPRPRSGSAMSDDDATRGDRRHLRHAGAAAHPYRGPRAPRACTTWHRRRWPRARSRRDERAERDAARRAASRRRFGAFLALLAAIAAIVVVALALLSSSGNGGVEPGRHGRRSAADRRAARLHPASTPAEHPLGLVGVGARRRSRRAARASAAP